MLQRVEPSFRAGIQVTLRSKQLSSSSTILQCYYCSRTVPISNTHPQNSAPIEGKVVAWLSSSFKHTSTLLLWIYCRQEDILLLPVWHMRKERLQMCLEKCKFHPCSPLHIELTFHSSVTGCLYCRFLGGGQRKHCFWLLWFALSTRCVQGGKKKRKQKHYHCKLGYAPVSPFLPLWL